MDWLKLNLNILKGLNLPADATEIKEDLEKLDQNYNRATRCGGCGRLFKSKHTGDECIVCEDKKK